LDKREYKNFPVIGTGYVKANISDLFPFENKVYEKRGDSIEISFESHEPVEVLCANTKKGYDVPISLSRNGLQTTIKVETEYFKNGRYTFYNNSGALFTYKIKLEGERKKREKKKEKTYQKDSLLCSLTVFDYWLPYIDSLYIYVATGNNNLLIIDRATGKLTDSVELDVKLHEYWFVSRSDGLGNILIFKGAPKYKRWYQGEWYFFNIFDKVIKKASLKEDKRTLQSYDYYDKNMILESNNDDFWEYYRSNYASVKYNDYLFEVSENKLNIYKLITTSSSL